MEKYALIKTAIRIMLPLCVLVVSSCSAEQEPKRISLANGLSEKELASSLRAEESGALRFGFDLRSSPQEDIKQYLPFLKYLSEATGLQFELYFIPTDDNIVDCLGKGTVQFAAIGADSYIQARAKYGVAPLVRGLNTDGEARYRSVIVVRPDSPIRKVKDLRNKLFAFGDRTSTQGHLIPRISLAHAGLTLRDLKSHEYTGSHRNCVNAVLSGRADACGMQDTMGMELANSGLIRIIHTSKYYPSSGIAVNKKVPEAVVARVKDALLKFDPQGRHAAGLYHWERTEMPNGFTAAQDDDYGSLLAWVKKFGYFPDTKPEILP